MGQYVSFQLAILNHHRSNLLLKCLSLQCGRTAKDLLGQCFDFVVAIDLPSLDNQLHVSLQQVVIFVFSLLAQRPHVLDLNVFLVDVGLD